MYDGERTQRQESQIIISKFFNDINFWQIILNDNKAHIDSVALKSPPGKSFVPVDGLTAVYVELTLTAATDCALFDDHGP